MKSVLCVGNYTFDTLQNGISQAGSLPSEASGSTHNLVPVHSLPQQQQILPQPPRSSHSNSNLLLNQAATSPSLDGAYRGIGAYPLASSGIISMGGDGLSRHIVNRACGYSNSNQHCQRHLQDSSNHGWGMKVGHLKNQGVGSKPFYGLDGGGVLDAASGFQDEKTKRIGRSFSGNDVGVTLHCQSHGHRHSNRGGFKGLSNLVGGFGEGRSYQNSSGTDDMDHLHRHLVISNPNSEDDDI